MTLAVANSAQAPLLSLAAKLTPVERARRGLTAVRSLLAATAERRRTAAGGAHGSVGMPSHQTGK